eukprot:gene14324-biopygen3905
MQPKFPCAKPNGWNFNSANSDVQGSHAGLNSVVNSRSWARLRIVTRCKKTTVTAKVLCLRAVGAGQLVDEAHDGQQKHFHSLHLVRVSKFQRGSEGVRDRNRAGIEAPIPPFARDRQLRYTDSGIDGWNINQYGR